MARIINFRHLNQAYLVCGKTDLRKEIDGLATPLLKNNLNWIHFCRHIDSGGDFYHGVTGYPDKCGRQQ